jgi:putative transposase
VALAQTQAYYPPRGHADGREAHAGIAGWFAFHHEVRINEALGNRAPMAHWREVVAVF